MRAAGDRATIAPSARAAGRVTVPGDKSISHRYAMLAALADGASVIHGYASGADCAATLECVRGLGAGVHRSGDAVVVTGRGLAGVRRPSAPLDAVNSGTTMRLMSGVLAGQRFSSVFTGDASLLRRPMRRIIEPLQQMGATIDSTGGFPPLTIHGAALKAIDFRGTVPSAQVKSCVLLAGLFADGTTFVEEAVPTRDHTERALETFGVHLTTTEGRVGLPGGQTLAPSEVHVPGDISSAAFWGALAGGTPGGRISIEGVGLNPTRTGLLGLLRRAGAVVSIEHSETGMLEPVGTVVIAHGEMRSFEILAEEVPGVIDEIPALAALTAMMPRGCTLTVRGADELRVKESDRISALASGFRSMGASVDEFADGFTLEAGPLHAATVDAHGDHRLAMAFAIAATRASGPVTILGASAVAVSYPGFFTTLAELTAPREPPVRRQIT
ncbi:MAG: 3-phosphoshikimate 1-carboxyvinyltransferase [Vicinamibacterales bacterium]